MQLKCQKNKGFAFAQLVFFKQQLVFESIHLFGVKKN